MLGWRVYEGGFVSRQEVGEHQGSILSMSLECGRYVTVSSL